MKQWKEKKKSVLIFSSTMTRALLQVDRGHTFRMKIYVWIAGKSFLLSQSWTRMCFQVKSYSDLAHFETAYVVKLHSVAKLAPPQRVSLFDTSLFPLCNIAAREKQSPDMYMVLWMPPNSISLSVLWCYILIVSSCTRSERTSMRGYDLRSGIISRAFCVFVCCFRYLLLNIQIMQSPTIGATKSFSSNSHQTQGPPQFTVSALPEAEWISAGSSVDVGFCITIGLFAHISERFVSQDTDCWSPVSVCVGFGGYFDAVLYKDIHLGIEPSTATPDMFSW